MTLTLKSSSTQDVTGQDGMEKDSKDPFPPSPPLCNHAHTLTQSLETQFPEVGYTINGIKIP